MCVIGFLDRYFVFVFFVCFFTDLGAKVMRFGEEGIVLGFEECESALELLGLGPRALVLEPNGDLPGLEPHLGREPRLLSWLQPTPHTEARA